MVMNMYRKQEQPQILAEIAYMPQLDSIRAVAVGLVVLLHWVPGQGVLWLRGSSGVHLFFVISGFLITSILLTAREKSTDQKRFQIVRRFYMRRALRIFPLYYLLILFALFIGIEDVADSFPWHFFYGTNFFIAFKGEYHGFVTHFWSLAAEEQFYLLWPTLVLFLPMARLGGLFVGVVIFGIGFNALGIGMGWFSSHFGYYFPAWSFSFMGMGALFAFWRFQCVQGVGAPWKGLFLEKLPILGLMGALLLTLYYFQTGGEVPKSVWGIFIYNTLYMLTLASVVVAAGKTIKGPVGAVLMFPPFRYIGRISYGIYLLHPFVITGVNLLFNHYGYSIMEIFGPIGRMLFLVSILILITSLSWFAFETPINRLKRFVPYH
ncbi:acyltransferase family protein [Magnetococcus sp. PR-3]|uniref:acyltransferase family protein n=1 Tax=Magnetococcus sp. PR-3 TaxID=3120355 RepID=UPI002FCE5995